MRKAKSEILRKINGAQITQLIGVAARLGVFDALKTPLPDSELTNKLKLDPERLKRLLNALVASYLINFDGALYSLSEEGHLLREDHEDSLKDLAIYKASSISFKPLEYLYEAITEGISPFEKAFGMNLFELLEENTELCEVFQNAMSAYVKKSSKVLLSLYDFTPFQRVCDIGGGTGAFLETVLDIAPHLKATCFDLPQTINLNKPHSHAGIEFCAGSFFESIPENYDLYFMRNILHDFSDEKCLTILQNLRSVLKRDSRLLIFETLVSNQGNQRLGKFSDITMMIQTPGGKERSEKEFKALCHQSGLRIIQTLKTTGAKALLEIGLKPA